MLRRGKLIAVVTLVAGAVVATIGVWLAWPRIVEEWYLARLDSRDPAVRLDAALRLAEGRSLRAIPRLMELIEKESRERADVSPRTPVGEDPSVRFTPIAHALYRIGPEGARRLEELVLRTQADLDDGLAGGNPIEFVSSFLGPTNPGYGRNVTFHFEFTWLIGAAVVCSWRYPQWRVEEQAYEASP